jgi:hypothetical protein
MNRNQISPFITSSSNGENIVIQQVRPSLIVAVGIKPTAPTLYFDIDSQYIDEDELSIINKELYQTLLNKGVLPNNDMVNELRESKLKILDKLREYISYKNRTWFFAKLSHYHSAIYMTKHGYHLVISMPTWDRVQYSLYELKAIFPRSNYYMNARILRLRISPKWQIEKPHHANVISPMPILYEHCDCNVWSTYHNKNNFDWDIRGEYTNPVMKELYHTYD